MDHGQSDSQVNAEVERGLQLGDMVRAAALAASGQETLVQAILRQGLVTPLADRVEHLGMAVAVQEEPLVDDQSYDLLAWLLQTAGDHPVALAPEQGVQLLFQGVNAGHGWVRFFRVEGEAYLRQVEAGFPQLVECATAETSPVVQGLLGLPIGVRLSQEAVEEILEQTRWRTGHWMAAVYVPHRNGFAPLGLGHDLVRSLSRGEALLQDGTPAMDVLMRNPDADLLPGRGNGSGLGALWGGEALVEGLSLGLKHSWRVDVQWAPVPYEALRGGSPFLGVEIPGAENGLLGVLIPSPTNRILVTFELAEDQDLVTIGPLDLESMKYLEMTFGVKVNAGGKGVLPASSVWKMVAAGLPIWNRLLRTV